jgi:hypothetical protein
MAQRAVQVRLELVSGREMFLRHYKLSQLRMSITVDVTLYGLQHFKVLDNLNALYHWVIEREGSMQSSGQISPNDKGFLTVKNVEIGLTPVRLRITEAVN